MSGSRVSEAVTNAIVHAFRDRAEPGTVTVTASVVDRELEIVVRDDGSGMAPRDDSPGLGLGLPLIRRAADGFEHREPLDGGSELWMCFRLPGSGRRSEDAEYEEEHERRDCRDQE